MKKIAKYGGIVLALIFIYFNYIHEPSDDKINKPIETRDIEYRAQGYLIKAGKQLNNKDTIETLFENVEAIYDGMVVTADKGRLTKEENLHLEGNIRGKADNGWTFEADKASYFNATKMITAEGNIKVINSETGAVVKGDKLKTDSKLANLDVTGNVNIAVAGGVLTADRASYSDNDKIIKIRDNIRLKGLADSKDNKSQYVGKFTQVDYDTKRREIIASGPFRQSKSTTKAGCQIDFLIQTTTKNLFVCEFKFKRRELGVDIISEVHDKVTALKVPRGFAVIPVLFTIGGVSSNVATSDYFYRIIDISDFLRTEDE